MSLLKIRQYLQARLFALLFRLPGPGLQQYIIPNWYYAIIFGVIAIDQITKLCIYAHMQVGEVRTLLSWPTKIDLYYIHNPGLGGTLHRILQPIFDRLPWEYEDMVTWPSVQLVGTLCAIGLVVIVYYYCIHVVIPRFSKYGHKPNLLWLGAALFLGAGFSNQVDHVFYGVLLNNSIVKGSPTRLFCGQVIDFIYFDNDIIPIFNRNFGIPNLADLIAYLGAILWLIGGCITLAVYIREDYKAWEQSLSVVQGIPLDSNLKPIFTLTHAFLILLPFIIVLTCFI